MPPRDLLESKPQRLCVSELTLGQQAQRGAERGEFVVGELDLRQVEVLGGKRIELRLEEPLTGPVDLELDAETVEFGPVRIEAAGEGILVHDAVTLDLPLDFQGGNGSALSHQKRDERELPDQLLGVLCHQRMTLPAIGLRAPR